MTKEEDFKKLADMSNEERANSEFWRELSFSNKFSFMWAHKKLVVFGAFILLMAAPFAINDFISKFSTSELKVTSTAETKN